MKPYPFSADASTCIDGLFPVYRLVIVSSGGTPLLMGVASAIGKLAFQEMKMRTAASRQARHKCKGFIPVFVLTSRHRKFLVTQDISILFVRFVRFVLGFTLFPQVPKYLRTNSLLSVISTSRKKV